jgi:hypothetical protein
LDSRYGDDKKRLEKKCERGLATCKTAIEKTNAGDDEPDDEAAEHEICVVELDASILGIDIHLQGVSSIGMRRVECWRLYIQ